MKVSVVQDDIKSIKSLILGKKCVFKTSRFANVSFQIEQICIISTHLKLWVAVVRHAFEWVKNKINQLSRLTVNPQSAEILTYKSWKPKGL